MRARLRTYRVRCGGCGRRLRSGKVSASTHGGRALCEDCGLALDRVRPILARLRLRLTPERELR